MRYYIASYESAGYFGSLDQAEQYCFRNGINTRLIRETYGGFDEGYRPSNVGSGEYTDRNRDEYWDWPHD
ncbi:MAG: hypothetical protein E6R04_01330 [Spirochaetes bacterium]|nr:MAG: hypothetical protein E6R04_01330 [Spirochaetota bacterium]